MAKVRYQMFIDEEQKRFLEEMHNKLNVPVAELIRRAIDRLRAEANFEATYPNLDRDAEQLLAVGGVCEGGPEDLADDHDAYLYGKPGR